MIIGYISRTSNLSVSNKKKLEKVAELRSLILERQSLSIALLEKNNITESDILIITPGCTKYLDETLLRHFSQLTGIIAVSSGVDWIDENYLKKNKINLIAVKGANAKSVAQHAWGMILGLSKRINEQEKDLVQNFFSDDGYEGFELEGKTLGVLGTGSIGKEVARVGKCFGMHTIGFNTSKKNVSYFDKITSASNLLKKSDVIVVALPLNPDTMHFIDAKKLENLKNSALLIVISRSEVVDKVSILNKLANKRLLGYAIDSSEKDVSDYLKYTNCIVTKHTAFNTSEAKQKMQDLAIEYALKKLQG